MSHYIIVSKNLKNVLIFNKKIEGVSKLHDNILAELFLLKWFKMTSINQRKQQQQ